MASRIRFSGLLWPKTPAIPSPCLGTWGQTPRTSGSFPAGFQTLSSTAWCPSFPSQNNHYQKRGFEGIWPASRRLARWLRITWSTNLDEHVLKNCKLYQCVWTFLVIVFGWISLLRFWVFSSRSGQYLNFCSLHFVKKNHWFAWINAPSSSSEKILISFVPPSKFLVSVSDLRPLESLLRWHGSLEWPTTFQD